MADEEQVESDWQRRRRLARVFGDVEPATTSDERDPGSSAGSSDPSDPSDQPGADSAGDRWLRAQVPPHHG